MKAQELKINNWVWLKSKQRYELVESGHEIDEGTDSDDYEPIPLTEDLLMKAGFTAKGISYNFILDGIEIASMQRVISTNERSCFYLDGEIPDNFKIRLNYLHQLQNLYFALTGEELEISNI